MLSRREALLSVAVGLSAQPKFKSDPFLLGVASGDPTPDSVVLWTRLLDAQPLAGAIPVSWEIAEDDAFKRMAQHGVAAADPAFAHSVHVDVRGLKAGRWYWYRFRASGFESPTGRTKTAPATGAADPFRFAFASCQKYEDGYFTAFEHMANEELDLVIHLGDYIYEGRCGRDKVRPHSEPVCITLQDYRRRYELYKRDPELKKAHARFPWAVVWDDHETADNYAGMIPDWDSPSDGFGARRAAAYQAYYEHMPLRTKPRGPDMTLYRQLVFGSMANLLMLDTRQYRSDQPCKDRLKPPCQERLATEMLGRKQEGWLRERLKDSRATWNILAQQVLMAELDVGDSFPMDKWDGYPSARARLLRFMAESRTPNPLVLTGDNHNNWVFDLREDFRKPESPVIATEFAGTSITSNGDGADISSEYGLALKSNPHIRYHDSRRGYVRCHLTAKQCQADYRQVPIVTRQGSPVLTKASFVVEAGRAGVRREL